MTGEASGFPNITRECPASIFVNLTAGAGRAASILPRVQKLFASHGFSAEFVLTDTADQLEDGVRKAISSGRKLLLALGGDGTFQGLANAAFGSEVVLGILPAGGGNDLASALGLPKDPLRAAETMLRAQPRWIDLVRARTGDGHERLYSGGGGVGLDSEAARYASGAFRGIPGRLRYVASALWAFRSFEAPTLNIEFPGTQILPLQAQSLLAGVLNSPTYGGGVRLAPDAQIDDGWLDLVIVEDLDLWKVMGILPALMRSGQLQTPHRKRARVKRLRLTTNPPCSFHGDGEIIGPTPVEVEIVPHAVQILAPLPP